MIQRWFGGAIAPPLEYVKGRQYFYEDFKKVFGKIINYINNSNIILYKPIVKNIVSNLRPRKGNITSALGRYRLFLAVSVLPVSPISLIRP